MASSATLLPFTATSTTTTDSGGRTRLLTLGVAVSETQLDAATEFFELFKTAWERAVPGRRYGAIISAGVPVDGLQAEAFVVYGSAHDCDNTGSPACWLRESPEDGTDPTPVCWGHVTFPLYGRSAHFDGSGSLLTADARSLDYRDQSVSGPVHRVGYDLFAEVHYLLTKGQPATYAATPTLDLHIAFLRTLLTDLKVAFVEIPPRPNGYDFVCCLTHDVDFVGLRKHTGDVTLLGFAWRASVGTLVDLIGRRRPLQDALRNWLAVLSTPMVFLRLLPDPWRPFDDYAAADRGHRSTFFVIPFKRTPGLSPEGVVPRRRGAPYGVAEIAQSVAGALARGDEIAVHGIDAWRDATKGRSELAAVHALTAASAPGVRLHWLYFSEASPEHLEHAGFSYDSTWGYNDAIGYRAGTSQVFRLLAGRALVELPMAIMDTAMFYAARMRLSPTDALHLCRAVLDHARRAGGTIVINWHDRSLAPERLWGRFYEALLDDIDAGARAWFATAAEAVEWFRWRRSITFREQSPGALRVTAAPRNTDLPSAQLEIHDQGPSAPLVRELSLDRETVAC